MFPFLRHMLLWVAAYVAPGPCFGAKAVCNRFGLSFSHRRFELASARPRSSTCATARASAHHMCARASPMLPTSSANTHLRPRHFPPPAAQLNSIASGKSAILASLAARFPCVRRRLSRARPPLVSRSTTGPRTPTTPSPSDRQAASRLHQRQRPANPSRCGIALLSGPEAGTPSTPKFPSATQSTSSAAQGRSRPDPCIGPWASAWRRIFELAAQSSSPGGVARRADRKSRDRLRSSESGALLAGRRAAPPGAAAGGARAGSPPAGAALVPCCRRVGPQHCPAPLRCCPVATNAATPAN